ncbi:alpha/beta fold hydrolase [Roseiterribacter gracilis]|uniref:Fluoroacetate dehalogenase n=1 Tax=Roseiterribacter gracilis TaxID=2812848 RepID=A0A8S8X7F1_9PROT|nr:fluoroacetate dehalogenase [Rhodospirillales bacterium TMPK1]
MFDGFSAATVEVGDTTIFVRRKGEGPPLLLLHGFPETHLMWRAVAPALAANFTVLCADLRGYGASGAPESDDQHAPYAKRAMANDMVQLMQAQGFARFSVAGHDRGARVAYRMALDHPDRVERLALLDVIPTGEAFDRADSRLTLDYWPWSLLAQPAPLPERLLGANPEAVVDDALGGWGSDRASFPDTVRDAYVDALRDPAKLHAICEEYRAAATIDRKDDESDRRAGKRIICPTLLLWAEASGLDRWYDGGPLAIWKDWAENVTGRAMSGGHFFAEQNPGATIAALHQFFRDSLR